MGNTLIQDAATGSVMGLTPGFVPIGFKEHGGIMYIASVNNEGVGEIGTIPSPIIRDIYKEKVDYEINKQLPIGSDSTPLKISHKMYPSDKFIVQLNLSVLDEETNQYSNAFDKTYTRNAYCFEKSESDWTSITYQISSPLITQQNTPEENNSESIITNKGIISLSLYSVNQNGFIKGNERLHEAQTLNDSISPYWFLPYHNTVGDFPSDLLELSLNGDLKRYPTDSKPGYLAVAANPESILEFGMLPRATAPYKVPYTFKQYNSDYTANYYSYLPGFYYKSDSGIFIDKLKITLKDTQTGEVLQHYTTHDGNTQLLETPVTINSVNEIPTSTLEVFDVQNGIPQILSKETTDTFILGCSKEITSYDETSYRSFESTDSNQDLKRHGLLYVDLQDNPNRWIEIKVDYFNQFDEQEGTFISKFNPYANDVFGTNLHVSDIQTNNWLKMSWRGDDVNNSEFIIPTSQITKQLFKDYNKSYSYQFPSIDGEFHTVSDNGVVKDAVEFTKSGLMTDVQNYSNLYMEELNSDSKLSSIQISLESDFNIKNLDYLQIIPNLNIKQDDHLTIVPTEPRVYYRTQDDKTDKFYLIKHYYPYHAGIRLSTSNAWHEVTKFASFYSSDFTVSTLGNQLYSAKKIHWCDEAKQSDKEDHGVPDYRPFFSGVELHESQLKKEQIYTIKKTKTVDPLINIPRLLDINFSGLLSDGKKTYDCWSIGYDIDTKNSIFSSKGAKLKASFKLNYSTTVTLQEQKLKTDNCSILNSFTIVGEDESFSNIPINKLNFTEETPWYKSNLELDSSGRPKNYINYMLLDQDKYSVNVSDSKKEIDSSIRQNNVTIQEGQILPIGVIPAGVYILNCNLIEATIPSNVLFQINGESINPIYNIKLYDDITKKGFIPQVIIMPQTGTCTIVNSGNTIDCSSIGLYKTTLQDFEIFQSLERQVYSLYEYNDLIASMISDDATPVEKYNYIQTHGAFIHLVFTYLEQIKTNSGYIKPKFMDYSYKGILLSPANAYQSNIIKVGTDYQFCYFCQTEKSNKIVSASDNGELHTLVTSQIFEKNQIINSTFKSQSTTNSSFTNGLINNNSTIFDYKDVESSGFITSVPII